MNERFYRFARAVACGALRFLFPIQVSGRENVPEDRCV